MSGDSVTIYYRRPPDRLDIFEQAVVERAPAWIATYVASVELKRPVTAGGRTILEPGAPIVWFTYPGVWHDIGRFHLADGEFTGIYANLLTPVAIDGDRWETTDLFLDVWVPVDGEPTLLDEDELEEALLRGWVDAQTAERVHEHARDLLDGAATGDWPPQHVHEWTLERVRERLG